MELVYLWVDKYKNIENKGFNFNPRFECEYKDGNLTIDEKKDHVNIFPGNINVTAIVGENGSGKSSILELITLDSFYPSVNHEETKVSPLSKPLEYFCVYWEIDNFYLKTHNMNVKCPIAQELENSVPYYIHYDYSFSKIPHHNTIINLNERIFLFPQKEEKFTEHIRNDEMKNILLVMKNNFYNKSKYTYFNPNQISISFDNRLMEMNDWLENAQQYRDYLQFLIDSKYRSFEEEIRFILNESKIPKLDEVRTNWQEIVNSVNMNLINQNVIKEEILRFDRLLTNFDQFANLISQSNDNILSRNEIDVCDSTTKTAFVRSRLDQYRRNLRINISNLDDEVIDLLVDLPKSIQLEVYDTDKEISYNHLSNGEKSLLNIRLYFENVMSKNPNENYIISIDEAETDLHPQWQKQVINYLIDSFKGYKVHFILSSHSPFILSDLPKKNVIFLENGEQKYPFKDNEQTFGANIHTLLSHGFFMDGLMGEFAKSKINDVYDFLSNPNTQTNITQIKAQEIINLIGEPILKKELQYLYDVKFETSEIERQIREHQEAIERLQAQRSRND